MKFKSFMHLFQKDLQDAVKTFNDGNEAPLYYLIVKIYQDAYQEGYLHGCNKSSESVIEKGPLELEPAEQDVKNFLDGKLLEFEKNKETKIFISDLYTEYSKYCKYNNINNHYKKHKFSRCVRKIIDMWYDTWEIKRLASKVSKVSKDRDYRYGLVYRPKISDEEKEKLCEPDKNVFVKYYTKECLGRLKGSLDSYTIEELGSMVLHYVNEKIDLRIMIGAGERAGRPWQKLESLLVFQVKMIRESLVS